MRVVKVWRNCWNTVILTTNNFMFFSFFSFFVQHESEAYFLNQFIGTFYSIRDDPAALHLTLKEYACNVHVSILLCPS
jgi:hypothetical protein